MNTFFQPIVFGYLVLPVLGIVAASYAQAGPNTSLLAVRPSSGCDLFAMLAVLDANMFLFKESLRPLINKSLAANYESIFMFAGVLACILLLQSGKLQYAISRSKKSYPVGQVLSNISIATGLISFHLYAFLGRGQ